MPPDEADMATVAIAKGVLRDCVEPSQPHIEELERFDEARKKAKQPISGLVPYAEAALFACIDDDVTYRQKGRALLKEDDLDPALRARLEEEASDDPLLLAKKRIQDDHTVQYGSAYNRIAGPLGRFALSGVLIPFNLLRSLVDVIAAENKEEPLSLHERQALVHWQEYLRRHPDTPEARKLEKKVTKFENKYIETLSQRHLKAANKLLSSGFPEGAHFHIEAILALDPDNRKAKRMLAGVNAQIAQNARLKKVSLQAPEAWIPEDQWESGYELGSDMLRGTAPLSSPKEAREPWTQILAFSEATQLENGPGEQAALDAFKEISKKRNSRSNMRRHALNIVGRPAENPYRFFRETRRTDAWRRTRWVMLGPMANGPKDRGLFRPLDWVLDAPALLMTVFTLPGRIIGYPGMTPWPFSREVSIHAQRYGEMFPEGDHEAEVLKWARWYEKRRHNAIGTLAIARQQGGLSPREEQKLEEAAAKQMLDACNEEPRPDLKMAMLQRTASEYPDTKAGTEAGEAARELWGNISPQHIRISRGFLEEHPEVAGPHGLGLKKQLMDGEARNGELHPEGVTIIGGRVIQVAFVDLHGDEDKPPEYAYEKLSAEQLSRLVSLLDEISQHKGQVDRDYEHGADPNRDYFFERARLGLTDTPDMRSGAYSSYEFEGVREKYGLVRSRESILPVDLVLQGSLYDMSFGAFPRMRMPEPTPDAVLYR